MPIGPAAERGQEQAREADALLLRALTTAGSEGRTVTELSEEAGLQDRRVRRRLDALTKAGRVSRTGLRYYPVRADLAPVIDSRAQADLLRPRSSRQQCTCAEKFTPAVSCGR
jgi:DNA-binding Lrp family transcriptional regulator